MLLMPMLAFALLHAASCAFLPGTSASPVDAPRASYEAPGLPGSEISYVHGGEEADPRVLFIHGTPGSAGNFARFVTDPPAGMRAISIDRPGFGESRPKAAVPELERQAAAVEPLLVKREGRWPILVGHSLGAPIAARVAAAHPDRVDGLVLVAGALDPELERVLLIQRVGNFLFFPYLLPRALRNANRELIPLKGELEELGPMLERIDCPVVIVHGRQDGLVPFENVAYMQERLGSGGRSVHVIELPEGNHFLPWNAEAQLRRAIDIIQGKLAGPEGEVEMEAPRILASPASEDQDS